jgi:hypothetical protein
VISHRAVILVALIWFLGGGFVVLRFTVQSHRALGWGRRPTPRQLKLTRVVGYMGVGFGLLMLAEIAVGLVSLK